MAAKRTESEAESSAYVDAVLTPRKNPRYDFFKDIKKRKEQGDEIKIKELSPGKNLTQAIKVAVSWTSRYSEKVFSFQGHDGDDYIMFKVFSPAMAEFMQKTKLFKVYKIRNFNVSEVDDRFRSSLDGKFEIILSNDSTMTQDDTKIEIPFQPLELRKVEKMAKDTVIDVQGIFVAAEDPRKTSGNKWVREVSMVDQSEVTIPVYFWEKDAESFDLPLKIPVEIRRVQVKEYGTEKVLWFQRSSIAVTENVDMDGTMAAWFKELTQGYM